MAADALFTAMLRCLLHSFAINVMSGGHEPNLNAALRAHPHIENQRRVVQVRNSYLPTMEHLYLLEKSFSLPYP
jgi:hypothetical protein